MEPVCGTIAPNGLYSGVYPGEGSVYFNSSVQRFEEMSGTSVDIEADFMDFGSTRLRFPTEQANSARARGGTLFLKLEPRNWLDANDRSFSLQSIIHGDHDDMLRSFATDAAAFGQPLFLTFGHEMNGNWYPWGENSADYIAAYRHVHDLINSIACNITWVWNPNVDRPLEIYYPGDAYVDWVALDGYQFNASQRRSPQGIFARDLATLRQFHRPIMIGETATGVDDPQWISDLFDFAADPNNGISALVYFNENKTESGERRDFAVSPGAEQTAYHAAVERHADLLASHIALANSSALQSGAVTTRPTLSENLYRPRIPFTEDQTIGRRRTDRISLDARAINESVPLEQLEFMLMAIADAPVETVMTAEDSWWETEEEFYASRPDLRTIADLDLRYEHYFSQYLRDPRTYWENAIILLSAYVQKSLEENRPENMERAMYLLVAFRQRMDVQVEVDTADQAGFAPAIYWESMLDLIEAEVRVQTPHQPEEFYLAGIEQTLAAINNILSLQYHPILPSLPDYFSIIKGILTLGDLYSQLAVLSRDERYYAVAQQLYQSVSRLQGPFGTLNPVGLSIDLTPLYDDPGLTSHSDVDLFAESNFGSHAIEASPMEIAEALYYNLENGFIIEGDVPLTETGIYHYLRGVALIKEAGLFSARPGVKTLEEIQRQIDQLNEGAAEIRQAAHDSRQNDERNLFFYRMAQLIEGDLLLAQADLTSLGGNYEGSITMIEDANTYSFVGTEPYFRYLSIWETIKHLEIQIRLAAYVQEEEIPGRNRERVSDARNLLEFCRNNRTRINAISEGAIVPEYFQTSFYYYMVILLIAGVAERDASGHAFYRGTGGRRTALARITYPLDAIGIIEELEQRFDFMPDGIREYYENNLAVKEAAAMIQISQSRDAVPAAISDRIRARSGQDLSPIDYALWLLRSVEKRTAPVIPPYLQYNLAVTLRHEFESGSPDMASVRRITLPLSAIIDRNVEDTASRDELHALVARIDRGERAAFDTLMVRIGALNQPAIDFIHQQTQRITWDFYSLHSDLYHSMTIAYSIQHGNRDSGHLMTQYANSAYLASRLSTSVYDREDRPFFIFQTTEIFEDEDFGPVAAEILERGRQNGTYLF